MQYADLLCRSSALILPHKQTRPGLPASSAASLHCAGVIFNTARGDPVEEYQAAQPFRSPDGTPRTEASETSFNSAQSNDRSFRTAGSIGTARSGKASFFCDSGQTKNADPMDSSKRKSLRTLAYHLHGRHTMYQTHGAALLSCIRQLLHLVPMLHRAVLWHWKPVSLMVA